jgi:7-cyano-7-deazaguanine synthase
VLALAQSRGLECLALTVDYGQRHRHELSAAAQVAQAMGGSALTQGYEVPKGRSEAEMEGGIPVTYVPARNTIMLSIALGWAEVWGAESLWTGVNAVDYSGYPDCRPEFVEAFGRLAQLATKAGVEGRPLAIEAPLIHLRKREIIEAGLALGVDYSQTSTCYDPGESGAPCRECDACLIRAAAFQELGMTDPAWR